MVEGLGGQGSGILTTTPTRPASDGLRRASPDVRGGNRGILGVGYSCLYRLRFRGLGFRVGV